MPLIPVTKCQGSGNDFVLLDNIAGADYRFSELSRKLCDRRFGVGADGMLVLLPSTTASADLALRIFNADGGEAEMCGNGVRCVARYAFEALPGAKRTLTLQTRAGLITTELSTRGREVDVRVNMGKPVLLADSAARLPAGTHAISMGNPHCVAFTNDDVRSFDLAGLFRAVDRSAAFASGANVEVARFGADEIEMRVFERGVGETMACGTGACAVAVAGIISGRSASPVRVSMPGGAVTVEWSGIGGDAMLTGGAELVFRTLVDVDESTVAAGATLP